MVPETSLVFLERSFFMFSSRKYDRVQVNVKLPTFPLVDIQRERITTKDVSHRLNQYLNLSSNENQIE